MLARKKDTPGSVRSPVPKVSQMPSAVTELNHQSGNAAEIIEKIQIRNDWYRDMSRKLMTALIVSGVVSFVCLLIAIVALSIKPSAEYFTTEDGRITQIIPVSQPMSDVNDVTNWVVNSVTTIIGVDFLNISDQLRSIEGFFTKEGYEAYLIALSESGNIRSIQQNRYIVKAVPTAAPRLIGEGLSSSGAYSYRFRIPLVISYHGSTATRNQTVEAVVTIQRVPFSSSNKYGIAIQQLIL